MQYWLFFILNGMSGKPIATHKHKDFFAKSFTQTGQWRAQERTKSTTKWWISLPFYTLKCGKIALEPLDW